MLTSVDFDLNPGEVHALIGENGAGKSTLLKIIDGIYTSEEGAIKIDNELVHISSALMAQEYGIALIHQEPLIFPDLTVAENIAIGKYPTNKYLPIVKWKQINDWARKSLELLDVKVDVKTRAGDLSTGQRRMLEIAEAFYGKARILLMDEPTAALTPNEVEHLFKIIRQLKDQGTSIVFVSHRLEEIIEIADRITILRDGKVVGQRLPKNTTIDEIISLMVGRELFITKRNIKKKIGPPVLEVENISSKGLFEDITFTIKEGEILGFSGLVGAGRTELAQALFGVNPIHSGKIKINGKLVNIKSPQMAIDLGLAYMSEDRQGEGLLMSFSVKNNMTIAILKSISKRGWVRDNVENTISEEYVKKLRIILRKIKQPIRELSGGNQQKVILSRWLIAKSKILILDEPTHGIDVGAKAEVHKLMYQLTENEVAILMISSEMPEILAMSDRIIVMKKGRISAHFEHSEATSEKIMAAMIGAAKVTKKVLS